MLGDLEKKGEMLIKYYPGRWPSMPEDDEDLIEKADLWTKQIGSHVIEDVKKFHPYLLARVKAKLKK